MEKFVSLANPISCQLNPTLWNIPDLYLFFSYTNGGIWREIAGGDFFFLIPNGNKRNGERVSEGGRGEKGRRGGCKNGNKAQLKFCCCSPSE